MTLLLWSIVALLALWSIFQKPAVTHQSRRLPRPGGLSLLAGLRGRAVGWNRGRYKVSRRMMEEAVQAYMSVYQLGRSEARRRARQFDSWIFRNSKAIGFYL